MNSDKLFTSNWKRSRVPASVRGQGATTFKERCLLRVKPGTIEEKVEKLRELELQATPEQRADFNYRLEV